MRINTKPVHPAVYTHEGAKASRINHEQELRRTVMACLLWEDNFYESGKSVADRIRDLVPKCRPEFVAACAYSARTDMKLRHVPLLLVAHMTFHTEHKKLVSKLLPDVIQRADEIAEFLAIYFSIGSKTMSAQVKKGLSKAFAKFDEYQLAKYNRDGLWKLRDALFMCHAKPTDAQGFTKHHRKEALQPKNGKLQGLFLAPHEELYRRLVDGELTVPNTWEVRLSSGEDKKFVFEDLMLSGQLGALAFIRNLRKMTEVGVDMTIIEEYSKVVKVDRILPFRFLSAARFVPRLEPVLEQMMFRCIEGTEKLKGRTVALIDVSGSMDRNISSKSDMRRLDAAYGLAILLREISENLRVFTFSNTIVEVPPRRGMALRDSMDTSQSHAGTRLGASINHIEHNCDYDRLIVFTDEQSSDVVPSPKGRGYMINVSTDKYGVGYGKWNHIDGFSESVLDYIRAIEALDSEVSE